METTVIIEKLQKHGEDLVWVPVPLRLNLARDFSIDDNDIEGELSRQGQLLAFYGDLAAEMKAQLMRKEDDLERCYSEIALICRKMGEKTTENNIKERVRTNETYIALQKQLYQSQADASRMDNLFRSMQKRADCVIALAYKARAELNKSMY